MVTLCILHIYCAIRWSKQVVVILAAVINNAYTLFGIQSCTWDIASWNFDFLRHFNETWKMLRQGKGI